MYLMHLKGAKIYQSCIWSCIWWYLVK